MFHPLRGKHFINAITVPLSANDFAERKKERKREREQSVDRKNYSFGSFKGEGGSCNETQQTSKDVFKSHVYFSL